MIFNYDAQVIFKLFPLRALLSKNKFINTPTPHIRSADAGLDNSGRPHWQNVPPFDPLTIHCDSSAFFTVLPLSALQACHLMHKQVLTSSYFPCKVICVGYTYIYDYYLCKVYPEFTPAIWIST